MSYSPPSPPTPPTPPEVLMARLEEERKRKEKQERQEVYIKLLLAKLKEISEGPRLITFLSNIISQNSSNIDLEKRYIIAQAINEEIESPNRDHSIALSKHFSEEIFNSNSKLYIALNYQRNFFAFTFFGEMSLISYNYARTLQTAQRIVLDEQRSTERNISHYHRTA